MALIGLPEEIKVFLTFLITQGLKSLWNLLGADFSGFGAALAAVIVGSILFFIEGLLGLVPPEWADLVAAALSLLAMLLAAFGAHYVYRNVVPS